LPQQHGQPSTAGDHAGEEPDEQSFGHVRILTKGCPKVCATSRRCGIDAIARPGYRFRY
jgi:hypothetical protein